LPCKKHHCQSQNVNNCFSHNKKEKIWKDEVSGDNWSNTKSNTLNGSQEMDDGTLGMFDGHLNELVVAVGQPGPRAPMRFRCFMNFMGGSYIYMVIKRLSWLAVHIAWYYLVFV